MHHALDLRHSVAASGAIAVLVMPGVDLDAWLVCDFAQLNPETACDSIAMALPCSYAHSRRVLWHRGWWTNPPTARPVPTRAVQPNTPPPTQSAGAGGILTHSQLQQIMGTSRDLTSMQ